MSINKEHIGKLAEDVYREYPSNPLDKPDWTFNRDIHVHKKRKAYVRGYEDAMKELYTKEQLFEAFSYYAFTPISSQPYTTGELEEEFEDFLKTIHENK